MNKRKNTLAYQYKRQRARIKATQTRLLKQGFIFTKEILPKEPKRITSASVRRLKKISIDAIYKATELIVNDEIISGATVRKAQKELVRKRRNEAARIRRQKKKEESSILRIPDQHDLILSNVYAELNSFPPAVAAALVKWFDDFVASKGKEAVAKAVQRHSRTFSDYISRTKNAYKKAMELYTSDLLQIMEEENFSTDIENLTEVFEEEDYNW